MKRRPLQSDDRVERDHDRSNGRFKHGNRAAVGNPTRSRAAVIRRQLVDALEADLPAVVGALLRKCRRGDVQALKLALSYGIGAPPSKPGAVDELTGERLATLITRTQHIKPRDIQAPDRQLVEDVSILAELGLPPDGISNLIGVDSPVLGDWLQEGEAEPTSISGELVRAYGAGLARYRLRLGVQAESRPLQILERRDPQSYGTTHVSQSEPSLPDEAFL